MSRPGPNNKHASYYYQHTSDDVVGGDDVLVLVGFVVISRDALALCCAFGIAFLSVMQFYILFTQFLLKNFHLHKQVSP